MWSSIHSGLPCHHMTAVVQSEGLHETNVMPIWWHTSHWRRQLPRASNMRCDFHLSNLRTKCTPQLKNCLCPPYTAPNKAGRPREEKRIKSAIEKALEKKKKPEVTNFKRQPVVPAVDDTPSHQRGREVPRT